MANGFDKEIEVKDFDTIANIAEDLVYRLPGCTDMMVRKTLQNTYREFAKASCVFKTVRHLPIVGKECHFGPTLPDMYVDAVVDVRLAERKLIEKLDYVIVNNSLISLLGMPNFDMGDGDEALKFIVDAADVPKEFHKGGVPALDIVCVEVPRHGSESAPSWFLEKFHDAIASGALYHLFSMKNKPWSDEAQAIVEKDAYNGFMNEARVRYVSGSQFGSGNLGNAIDTSVII